MNLIFIGSYLNVPDVIDTIESEGDKFTILTSDKNLISLFGTLYGSEHLIELPELFSSFGNIKIFLHDLLKLSRYKKSILNACKNLNPNKIFFYYIGWNGFTSWLIKNLAIYAKVYYRPKVNRNDILKNNSLRMITKALVASILFGIRFESSFYYGYPMLTIGDNFLQEVRACKYDRTIEPNNIINFLKNRFAEFKDIAVLLLVGGEYNLDENIYRRKMHDLYEILIKYYEPSKICIKNHPNFPNLDFAWAKNCVVAAKEIPANLIFYLANLVIGYGSATLFEAANFGKIAISTVDLIPATLKTQSANVKEYLLANSLNRNIDFPQNEQEFASIVAGEC